MFLFCVTLENISSPHISDFRLQQFQTGAFKDILSILFFSFLFSMNIWNHYEN